MASQPAKSPLPEDESKHAEPTDTASLGGKGETLTYSATRSIDPVAERRIVWKFDLRILPLLAVMYLFNSLDKSNMGNAKTAGLVEDLNLKGNQYNILLSVSPLRVTRKSRTDDTGLLHSVRTDSSILGTPRQEVRSIPSPSRNDGGLWLDDSFNCCGEELLGPVCHQMVPRHV